MTQSLPYPTTSDEMNLMQWPNFELPRQPDQMSPRVYFYVQGSPLINAHTYLALQYSQSCLYPCLYTLHFFTMADNVQTNGEVAATATPATTTTVTTKIKEEGSPKLFIGQIPRAWGELELMNLMVENGGPVFELVIMKDRVCNFIFLYFFFIFL